MQSIFRPKSVSLSVHIDLYLPTRNKSIQHTLRTTGNHEQGFHETNLGTGSNANKRNITKSYSKHSFQFGYLPWNVSK